MKPGFRCDRCQREDRRSDGYDLPPQGWFTVTEGIGHPSRLEDQHFCSRACLVEGVQTLVSPATPPPDQPDEVPAETEVIQ
jgi:hypothetical protein